MSKITLDLNSFKALASETRLEILRKLDGRKMTLNDISRSTTLNKATLHEHLAKLNESGLVKRIEREGHKWVYYKLSWKGSSLLHPDNSRIVVMFTTTFAILFLGVVGFISYIRNNLLQANQKRELILAPDLGDSGKINETYDIALRNFNYIGENPIFLYIAIACIILFVILFVFTIRRYRKNKTQKL